MTKAIEIFVDANEGFQAGADPLKVTILEGAKASAANAAAKAAMTAPVQGSDAEDVSTDDEPSFLEVSVSSQGVPSLSTSLQIGPASGENGWVSGKGSCHDVVAGNITTGTGGNLTSATVVNPYHGNYGVDIMSGLTNLTESFYASFHDFRLEWHLNHTIH